MSFRSLALACSFVSAAHVFAQGDAAPATDTGAPVSYSDSEYLHQAPGGKFELTPGINIESVRYEYKTTPIEATIYNIPFTVKGEYGFTDMFSLSAQLGYGVGGTSYEDCPTTCPDRVTQNGVLDPIISANLRVPIGSGALRAGLDFSFSTEDSKIESNGDSNQASGGTTLTPYLGYEVTFGRNILGAKVSYDAVKGDRTEKDSTSTPTDNIKYSGGEDTMVNVFYEFNFPRVVALGTAVEWINSSESKSSTNGGPKTEDDNEVSLLRVRVYVPLEFNETITLVPALAVGGLDYESASNLDSATYTSLGVIGRFTF